MRFKQGDEVKENPNNPLPCNCTACEDFRKYGGKVETRNFHHITVKINVVGGWTDSDIEHFIRAEQNEALDKISTNYNI